MAVWSCALVLLGFLDAAAGWLGGRLCRTNKDNLLQCCTTNATTSCCKAPRNSSIPESKLCFDQNTQMANVSDGHYFYVILMNPAAVIRTGHAKGTWGDSHDFKEDLVISEVSSAVEPIDLGVNVSNFVSAKRLCRANGKESYCCNTTTSTSCCKALHDTLKPESHTLCFDEGTEIANVSSHQKTFSYELSMVREGTLWGRRWIGYMKGTFGSSHNYLNETLLASEIASAKETPVFI